MSVTALQQASIRGVHTSCLRLMWIDQSRKVALIRCRRPWTPWLRRLRVKGLPNRILEELAQTTEGRIRLRRGRGTSAAEASVEESPTEDQQRRARWAGSPEWSTAGGLVGSVQPGGWSSGKAMSSFCGFLSRRIWSEPTDYYRFASGSWAVTTGGEVSP